MLVEYILNHWKSIKKPRKAYKTPLFYIRIFKYYNILYWGGLLRDFLEGGFR